MKKITIAALVFLCLLVITLYDDLKQHSAQLVNGAVGWTGHELPDPYPRIVVGVMAVAAGVGLYLIESQSRARGGGGSRPTGAVPWPRIFYSSGCLVLVVALVGSCALASLSAWEDGKREEARQARADAEKKRRDALEAAGDKAIVARLAARAVTRVNGSLAVEIDSADMTRLQTIVRVIVHNKAGTEVKFQLASSLALYDARGVEIWQASGKAMGSGTNWFNTTQPGTSKIFSYRFPERRPDRTAAAGKITLTHYRGWSQSATTVNVRFSLKP